MIRFYLNVTSPGHSIAMKARGKLFIHQGRTTLYQLFRYTYQCRFNAMFT